MKNSKKGISIIAVLLFMLIATIAGTATYKWLSSEGRSSASRMFQSEARMAAVAGIESARSWFAHHGNETGEIVKHVKSIKSKDKAVKLDNQLVAFKKDKQNYSVYVVDVDDSKQPYKIKVVSEGSSRDGKAKFRETAVFKVSGLYQVAKPTKTSPVNFDANYFGGSTELSQGNRAESMIVNGNLTGNELDVQRKLVVTGNVTNFTNKIGLADTNCIGGDLSLANQGLSTLGTVTYVGGKTSNFSVVNDGLVGGSYYFNGDFSVPSTEMGKPVVIGGDVTINGDYTGTNVGKKVTINGDLCLSDNSHMNFMKPTSLEKGGFVAGGSVWIPKGDAMSNSGESNYKFVQLGGVNKKINIANMQKCPTGGSYKDYGTGSGLAVSDVKIDNFQSCPEDMYFQVSSSAPVEKSGCIEHDPWRCAKWSGLRCVEYECKKTGTWNEYPSYAIFTTKTTESLSSRPACADEVKEFCTESYLNTSNKCPDGTTNKIDDLLSTAAKYYGGSNYQSSCVQDKIVNSTGDIQNGKAIDILNSCYSTSSSELYNGFLVVKVGAAKMNNMFGSTNGKSLKGKFIFYVNENQNSGTKFTGKLPPTDKMDTGEESSVFMYLPNGAGEITQGGGGSGVYRYFIYSLSDIASIGAEGSGKWIGSFYFSAEKCAKLGKFGNGNVQTVSYDAGFITDLANSGILCNANDIDCGGDVTGSSSGSASGSSADSENKDTVYVAVGASLLVELESQYKTTEKVDKFEEAQPAVVVLPRIVYLNSDAEGELRDYFSPVALNGAKILGDGSLNCTNKKLEEVPLPDLDENTNASCTYTNSVEGKNYKSDFFVVIEGSASAIPKVGFDGDAAINLGTEENHQIEVILNIGAVNNGSGEYEMDIVVAGHLDWITNAKTNSNFTLVSSSDTERRYHLKGAITANEMTADLFEVSTTTSSSTGNLVFTIENPRNCRPVAAVKAITLRGSMKVVRKPISEYCNKDENRGGDYCKSVVNAEFNAAPSCEDWIKNNFGSNFEWVTANGDECVVTSDNNGVLQPNNMWKCYMGTSIDLLQKNSSSIDEYCMVYIPSANNTIMTFADNSDQHLYAEIKHKKKTIDIHLRGRSSGYSVMYASTKGYASLSAVLKAIDDGELSNPVECRDSHCTEDVYAGYHLYLLGKSAGSDKFSYWEHPSSVAGAANVKVDGNPFHIVVKKDTTVYGIFNARDDHCFYDNFDGTDIFCKPDSYNCIDHCSVSSADAHCSLDEGHPNLNANWTMVYSNTPQNCIEYGSAGWFGSCNEHNLLEKDYGSCCRQEGYYKPLKKSENGLYFRRGGPTVMLDGFAVSSGLNGDDHKDGQVSVVLNHVDAGANGTLTASFYTENIPYTSDATDKFLIFNVPQFLNSGFILRSNDNASKYLTLGIYGKSLGGSEAGSVNMYARVCYFDAAQSKDGDGKTMEQATRENCMADELIYSGVGNLKIKVPVTALNKLNLEAKLQGNSLDVSVGVEQILGKNSVNLSTVHFDLSAAPFSNVYSEGEDNTYNRVGLKLADDGFRVYDIAWRSEGEDCWDTPYAACSFAANYVGGRVPENQDAMPWVTTSTWLSDKVASGECGVTYFYNGCDMDDNRYQNSGSLYDLFNSWRETAKAWLGGAICRDKSSTGLYWDDQDGNRDGRPLKGGTQYNFSYRGLHGETVSPPDYAHTGIVRNASVRITCEGMKRSYTANCGAFWVGEIHECTQDEKILAYEGPSSGFEYFSSDMGTDKSFILENAINLRNASLVFAFAENSDPATFYMKDESGHASATIAISVADHIVEVDKLVDEFGFDPENVKELVFYSKGVFLINSITSECASAPSATCTGASYSAEEGWKLSGTATNGESCEMIVTNGGETKTASVVCGSSPMVPVISSEATALNDWVNSFNTDTEFKVSLKVTKGEAFATCEPAIAVPVEYVAPVVTPKPYAPATAKSATCSKIGKGVYRVDVNGCDSYDNCSVKTQKNDYAPEVVCNWVTYGCDVTLYNSGTYDILFNDGSNDRRLAGCSGIVFEEGENND